jgi:predicted RNA binding protein YcfA (HicA-like mRNA interferase family)
MKSSELLRKLKKVAKRRGVEFQVFPGKDSHQKIRLGANATILPMHVTELPTGTYRAILKDLEVKEEEL